MKTYLTRKDAESILDVMNKLSDHDVFLLEVDNSSGIGSTITLTVDINYNNLAGKFITEIGSIDNW
jgi:hypothetical protein